MIGWVAVILSVALFLLVMAALAREAHRPLDETDEYCAAVDEDMDRLYSPGGGWRL